MTFSKAVAKLTRFNPELICASDGVWLATWDWRRERRQYDFLGEVDVSELQLWRVDRHYDISFTAEAPDRYGV